MKQSKLYPCCIVGVADVSNTPNGETVKVIGLSFPVVDAEGGFNEHSEFEDFFIPVDAAKDLIAALSECVKEVGSQAG